MNSDAVLIFIACHSQERPMASAVSDMGESAEQQRAHIRSRIAAKLLPRRTENQLIYAGYGVDQPCDCCGRPIRRTDVEYEIEIKCNSAMPKILTMHLGCFEVWVTESGPTGQQVAQ
jgi:hypothetical protein